MTARVHIKDAMTILDENSKYLPEGEYKKLADLLMMANQTAPAPPAPAPTVQHDYPPHWNNGLNFNIPVPPMNTDVINESEFNLRVNIITKLKREKCLRLTDPTRKSFIINVLKEKNVYYNGGETLKELEDIYIANCVNTAWSFFTTEEKWLKSFYKKEKEHHNNMIDRRIAEINSTIH